jgi:hypothetical protein
MFVLIMFTVHPMITHFSYLKKFLPNENKAVQKQEFKY